VANDVVQLIIAYNCAGQFAETVQHYEANVVSGDPQAVAVKLIDGFRNNAETQLADCLASDTSIVGYRARRVNNGGGLQVSLSITPVGGSVAGTSATSGTAVVILNKFTNGARWVNGKMFVPGIPEGGLAGNVISPAQLTLIGDFITANAGFTETPYTYSYGTWSTKPPTPLFYPPAFTQPSRKPGIQKRRLLPS